MGASQRRRFNLLCIPLFMQGDTVITPSMSNKYYLLSICACYSVIQLVINNFTVFIAFVLIEFEKLYVGCVMKGAIAICFELGCSSEMNLG